MNKISARQLYFYLACIAPVGKLLLLPSLLAQDAKNDLLFPVLVHLAVQAGVIFCVLLLAKRNESFYELLQNTFGSVVAKILITLFSLFLLYAALLPLMEQKLFVQSVFYDTLPSLVTFAPYFLFAAYLCAKPLFSFGRTWDALAPIAVAGYVGILLLSVGSADFGALLPVGAGGGGGFLKGTARAASWFFDSAFLMTLLGKIDYRKGMAWKGLLCYLSGGVALLFFLAVFYGIFEETALGQMFAFAKTSKYFSGITVLGRIDYLFIFALSLVMAFSCTLPLQGSIDCILQAYGRKKYLPAILAVAVGVLFFVLLLLLDYRIGDVLNVVSGTVFWIFPVFSVAVPLLSLLLRRSRRETA